MDRENEELFLKMQTELMRRAGCAPGDNVRCEEWIRGYAKKLRDLANSRPEILDAWAAHPEDTMREIEALLVPEGGHDHSV